MRHRTGIALAIVACLTLSCILGCNTCRLGCTMPLCHDTADMPRLMNDYGNNDWRDAEQQRGAPPRHRHTHDDRSGSITSQYQIAMASACTSSDGSTRTALETQHWDRTSALRSLSPIQRRGGTLGFRSGLQVQPSHDPLDHEPAPLTDCLYVSRDIRDERQVGQFLQQHDFLYGDSVPLGFYSRR